MGNLTVDPLAIAALVGFGSLIVISVAISVWMYKKSGKAAGEQ